MKRTVRWYGTIGPFGGLYDVVRSMEAGQRLAFNSRLGMVPVTITYDDGSRPKKKTKK